MEFFNYKNLCLEGGGILAYAYPGALKVLEDSGILANIDNYCGTSSGALVATMLYCGFTPIEIRKISTVINKELGFINKSTNNCLLNVVNKIRDLKSLSSNYGVHSLSHLENAIREILLPRVDPDITLKNLYLKFGKKELVIVACNLDQKKTVYFHHAMYGYVSLIDALLASMAVPIFFQPKQIKIFDPIRSISVQNFFVDGALTENFPIWIFDNMNMLYSGKIGKMIGSANNPETLGLKLDTNSNLENITSFNDFMSQLFSTIIDGNRLVHYTNQELVSLDSYNIVPIGIPDNFDQLNFGISETDVCRLVKYGTESTNRWISNQLIIGKLI